MEAFTYKGIADGKYVEGEIEAINQDEASHKLKEQKVIITNLIKSKKKKAEKKEKSKGKGLSLFGKKKVKVVSFDNLTTDLCKKYRSNIILRGLRVVSDFEYEFQLSGMNKKLNKNIETIFLMSDVENQIISSKLVKEIFEV